MNVLPCLDNAYLQIEGDTIVGYGLMSEILNLKSDIVYDAMGQFVLPTWCDSHTHIVYAGSREQEFEDKIKGMTYAEIAQKGGGILNSAQKLNQTSEDELFAQAWQRLETVKRLGTGAIEIKSGYGLTVEGELKMLRVIKRLKAAFKFDHKSHFFSGARLPYRF